MLLIIITIISFFIGLGTAIYYYLDDGYIINNLLSGLLISILSWTILGLISLILAIGFTDFANTTTKMINETKILKLQDNYFLGTTNINGSLQYIYKIKTADGIQIKTFNISDISVIQEENLNPRVCEFEEIPTNNIIKKWFWLGKTSKVKIYIPKGSIKYDFITN